MNVYVIAGIVVILVIISIVLGVVLGRKGSQSQCIKPLPNLPQLWNTTWKLRSSIDGPVIANITFDNYGVTQIVTATTDKPFDGTAFNGMKTSQTYKVTNLPSGWKFVPQLNPLDPSLTVYRNDCHTAWVLENSLGLVDKSYLTSS